MSNLGLGGVRVNYALEWLPNTSIILASTSAGQRLLLPLMSTLCQVTGKYIWKKVRGHKKLHLILVLNPGRFGSVGDDLDVSKDKRGGGCRKVM